MFLRETHYGENEAGHTVANGLVSGESIKGRSRNSLSQGNIWIRDRVDTMRKEVWGDKSQREETAPTHSRDQRLETRLSQLSVPSPQFHLGRDYSSRQLQPWVYIFHWPHLPEIRCSNIMSTQKFWLLSVFGHLPSEGIPESGYSQT